MFSARSTGGRRFHPASRWLAWLTRTPTIWPCVIILTITIFVSGSAQSERRMLKTVVGLRGRGLCHSHVGEVGRTPRQHVTRRCQRLRPRLSESSKRSTLLGTGTRRRVRLLVKKFRL